MADLDPVTHNIEVAQRIQERFEAYLLTLTFTLTGLAVQTAHFGTFVGQDVLELIGWVALLVSGLAGLSRAEWMPQLFGAESKRVAADMQGKALQKAVLAGTRSAYVLEDSKTVSVTEPLERAQATAKYMGDVVAKMERRAKRKYQLQRITFVIGLIALMSARGWQPLSTIGRALIGIVSRVCV